MDDTRQLLVETAERIFADHCDKALLDAAEQGRFPEALWNVVRDNGFHELAMADSGVDLKDAFAVVRAAGRHALPLPLAEILLANRWLQGSDSLCVVGRLEAAGNGRRVIDVPWAAQADQVLGLDWDGGDAVVVPAAQGATTAGRNLAGEPRDDVPAPDGADTLGFNEPAFELLALGRVAATAGALERILELSLQYANEREQFGRPIGKFQAIQHTLAVMAGEVAAASRAADAALDALDGDRFALEVAAAKARVGEAAGLVAESAHQVHGAMGFTHEHQLHHFTRRVWAWRDEYGNEAYWQQRLGRHLAALGADQAWDFMATRG
jgi:acyl-CoA dehydrogenase